MGQRHKRHAKQIPSSYEQDVAEKLHDTYFDWKQPAGLSSIAKLKATLPLEQRWRVLPWLRAQSVYTTHHVRRKKYPTNFYTSFRRDQTWEMDLADFQRLAPENKPYRYALVVIDTFDRHCWLELLRNKTADEVLAAIRNVLEKSGRQPEVLRSDKGGEFYSRAMTLFLKRKGIHQQLAGNQVKASQCERVIRTLKSKLYKVFYVRGSYKYTDVIQDIVESYNNSVHRSLGVAPNQVNDSNQFDIYKQYYLSHVHGPPKPYKYKVGQYVRLAVKRELLDDRGFKRAFTEEVFRIYHRRNHHKTGYLTEPIYFLKDLNENEILPAAYEYELTPIVFDPETHEYLVEDIVKTRIDPKTKKKQHLVKFLGYSKDFNIWMDADSVKLRQK